MRGVGTDASGQTVVPGVSGGTYGYLVVIGWSASIGTNIAAVQNWLNHGNPASDGWIGQSAVGGPFLLGDNAIVPAPPVFGTAPPKVTGFTLGLASPMNLQYSAATLPSPVLTTTLLGSSIKLSWPAIYSNYGVQSATSFMGPWNDVGGTPVTEGTNLTKTISISGQPPYFRLIVQ
jgi:hypothetical protein